LNVDGSDGGNGGGKVALTPAKRRAILNHVPGKRTEYSELLTRL
jgi:hypothetical protein